MKSSSIEKDKKIEDKIIKDIRNLFRLKKENEAIKGRIIRHLKNTLKAFDDFRNKQQKCMK